MRNILECFMFLVFGFTVLCFTYQNAGGLVRSMRPDHCGSIHMVIAIALKSYKWKIMKYHGIIIE